MCFYETGDCMGKEHEWDQMTGQQRSSSSLALESNERYFVALTLIISCIAQLSLHAAQTGEECCCSSVKHRPTEAGEDMRSA